MIRYHFQHFGDALVDKWIVSVPRKAFTSGKRPATLRDEVVLGTISLHTKLVDTEFDLYFKDWYEGNEQLKAEGAALLKGERGDMWPQLIKAREAHYKNEQNNGPFCVKIGSEVSRWNTSQRAHEYAEERLKAIWRFGLQTSRRAEVSRLDTAKVFLVLEINEYGHIEFGSLAAKKS